MTKSYYQDEHVILYHGDCREILPTIAADVLVTDPPYGIALANHDGGGARSDRSFGVIGDHSQEIGEAVISWATERNMPAVIFASPFAPWRGSWRNLIAWDKGGAVGGGGDISTCLKRSWELIQIARNGPMNGQRDESVWRHVVVPDDSAFHVCAKPIGLMMRLIARFTSQNDTIFDPFAGSGSTLIAAADLNRKAIGIEIEERYCEIAARRLASRTGNLFA